MLGFWDFGAYLTLYIKKRSKGQEKKGKLCSQLTRLKKTGHKVEEVIDPGEWEIAM